MEITVMEIPDEITMKVYGVDTMEEVRAIQEEEQKQWCNNPNHKFEDSYFVPDGADKREPKHHYRCRTCHKITQIG